MHLAPISIDIWKIYTPCRQNGLVPLLETLSSLDAKYHASRARLLTILKRASTESRGPALFNDDIAHLINAKEKLYEFIAGDLRLPWFYSEAEKKVIICCDVFIKKSQKTKKQHINAAIIIKKAYEEAVKTGTLEFGH